MVVLSFFSQEIRERKEGRTEEKKKQSERRNRGKDIVKVRNEKPKVSERNWRESEVEACGGLWAGVAAASAQSADRSSLR